MVKYTKQNGRPLYSIQQAAYIRVSNGTYTILLRLYGFGDKCIYMCIVEISYAESYSINLQRNMWRFSIIIVAMEMQQCDPFVLFLTYV